MQKLWIEMKSNSSLSIVIPTFNRAKFLDRCLELVIPSARKHGISIYISDNASEDNTKDIVDRRIREYALIEYSCNMNNFGADKNFEAALRMPKTEYVWLLGDTYQIHPESIDFLIEMLSLGGLHVDAFIFNVENRVKNFRICNYLEKNKLLTDLGWHMTCMSSLVYSKGLLLDADFGRYRKTNFIQTGIIFEYIENKNFLVRWIGSHSIQSIAIDGVYKNSWQKDTLEIWVERWSNFVLSLPPSYALAAKLRCVKDHGLKTKMFSIHNLLLLRSSGALDFVTCCKYKYILPFVVSSMGFFVFLVSLVPRALSRALLHIIFGR